MRNFRNFSRKNTEKKRYFLTVDCIIFLWKKQGFFDKIREITEMRKVGEKMRK